MIEAQPERHLRVVETPSPVREAEPPMPATPISRPAQIHELQATSASAFAAMLAHADISDAQKAMIVALAERVTRLEKENRALWFMLAILTAIVLLLTATIAFAL